MEKINKIIFDLDGTLLDTSYGVMKSVQYVISELHLHCLNHNEVFKFNGQPINKSFIEYCGCSIEKAEIATEMFRAHYAEYTLFDAEAYDGIYDLCRSLCEKGCLLSVATYKREDYAIKLLRHFGFDKYCVSMHGSDVKGQLSKSDIIRLCMNDLGGIKDDYILVGDTLNDARGAYETGIGFIAITYGYGFKNIEDVKKYPHIGIANKTSDIWDILNLYC